MRTGWLLALVGPHFISSCAVRSSASVDRPVVEVAVRARLAQDQVQRFFVSHNPPRWWISLV